MRNTFEAHIVNKRDHAVTVDIASLDLPPGVEVDCAPRIELAALASARTLFVARFPRGHATFSRPIRIRVSSGDTTIVLEAPLLAPMR